MRSSKFDQRRRPRLASKQWDNHLALRFQKVPKMNHARLGFARYRTPMLAVMITLGTLILAQSSHAAACVNGVYRAGCVGPNGAVGVHKAYPHHYGYGGYHHPVSCAHGP